MKALTHIAHRGGQPRRLTARGLDLGIAAGLTMCAAAAGIAIGNEGLEHRYITATVAVLLIAAPLSIGVYAWRSGVSRRLGAVLAVGAVGIFVTTLANSGASLPYSVGRLAGWAMEVAIIYVLLAYPTGRLRSRGDRLAVAFAAAIVVLLFLPSALVLESLPTPSPWTGCTGDCPDNAFAIAGGVEASGFLTPIREIAAGSLYVVVTLLLIGHQRRASTLARTSLTPVLAVAIIRFGGAGAFLALRASGASTDVVAVSALVMALTIPLIAVGFLVGMMRWRLRAAHALERLGAGVDSARGGAALQALLAESLGDPALRLYVRSPGGWRDADGADVPHPVAGRGRFLLPVDNGEGPVASVACDGAIRSQGALLEAVAANVRSALEHRRLADLLAETREEVAASRARIAAAADGERRRIERDIHDGAQQRLIALGIGLEAAETAMKDDDPADAAAILGGLRRQIGEVIDEVRALCHGIYPPLLTAAGPADALRSVALEVPVPVTVRDRGLTRHPEETESAVYFCCMEAIQNAVKHGGSVRAIDIDIEERGGEVRFVVADDGRGFDAGAANGAGITNMRDRVAALGGELTIRFPARGGTAVAGLIPIGERVAQGPNWAIPGGGSGGGAGGAGGGSGGGADGGTASTTGAEAGGG